MTDVDVLQLDAGENVWCRASAWFVSSCAVRFFGSDFWLRGKALVAV